ncbi:hypothetical protein F5Y02DRAFT_385192 [Annulohypoxylon stygium]|nr:hypothetical protein F5Y02DRAFT_385192 [Annulohypoxylon stygium]
MSSSKNDLRSVMESTMLTFFKHQELNHNIDPSLPVSLVTPDCLWYNKPDSFTAKYPFVDSVKTTAQQKEHFEQEIKVLEESRGNILVSTVDAVARKGSAHIQYSTKFVGSEPSTMDICWFVDFTDDGKKILKVVKFIDTAAGAKVIEQMAKGGYKLES